MIVTFNKKPLIEIISIIELEFFIIEKNIYKNFKSFNENDRIVVKDFITSTNHIGFKSLKDNFLKKILYHGSNLKTEYWLCRGYTENESSLMISEIQKLYAKKAVLKSKKEKEVNHHQWSVKHNTNINYWLNKGFNEDEAKEKLTERQKTFTLKKCIEKHGEVDGKKIWKDRQEKWVNTLTKKYGENREFNLDGKSYDHLYSKYGGDFITKLDRMGYKIELYELIINLINLCKNIDEVVDYIIKDNEIKLIYDIHPIIRSKIVLSHFNVSYDTLKQNILDKLGYREYKNIYGTTIYHNGFRFKSKVEYEIALFLEDNNITYEYDKLYPNQNKKLKGYKCDFYLPTYNVYLEYCGLLKLDHYKNIVEIKKKQFKDLNCFFSENFTEIKNYLLSL